MNRPLRELGDTEFARKFCAMQGGDDAAVCKILRKGSIAQFPKRSDMVLQKKWILMIVGAFVLGVSFFVILALERQARSYYVDGVVLVTPRIDDAWYHVPLTRVDDLVPFFPEHNIVGVARNKQRLSTDLHNTVAWVYHTSQRYFELYQVDFTEGTAQFHYNEIVLNKSLAWQLFGNTENVVGLRVILMGEAYTVCGVVSKGDEPAAWRITIPPDIDAFAPENISDIEHFRGGESINVSRNCYIARDGMVTALYIRANEHDPLAIATARHILSNHLFINPDYYYVIDIGRVAGSIGIRARVLAVFVLLAIAASVLIRLFAMIRGRRYLICILYIIGLSVCAFIVATILKGILTWLPNPATIDINMFVYIFSPAAPLYLVRLNLLVNVAFAVGLSVILFLSYSKSTNLL